MRVNSGRKFKVDTAKKNSRKCYGSGCAGSLSIVGIGPGHPDQITPKAKAAISKSHLIVGYRTYIDLLNGLVSGKKVISSGMTREVERAAYAIRSALAGKRVCVISSGDPGVYGMAGLIFELLDKEKASALKIRVIPGISSALSCASILGAPLMNDFAVISLSDLLTGREIIEKRVKYAAEGDFVIVFYNPRSKKRVAPLKNAWKILLKYKPPLTPVAIIKNAYRKGEEVTLTRLGETVDFDKIDMLTTIIIGNSKTYFKGKYMITPRGYKL